MGTIGIYPKFHGFDREGLPLEGGRLYSFLSGTSTPHSMYADASLSTPLENPIVLDSSGEALFYSNGTALKWILKDAQDTLLWEIDPVSGTGSGSGLVGVGSGCHTIALRPEAGSAQATGVVFPDGVLAMAVTLWVSETLGTTQGLEQVGVGTLTLPDCWGMLPALTAATETTAGVFQAYGGQPQHAPGTVTLTAYGGLFDGSGEVYITGHFLRFQAGVHEGYSYQGASSGGGIPAATTDVSGVVELADSPETLAGLRGDRAVTPLGLAATLATLPGVVPGTETQAGVLELATSAEVALGLDATRAVSPATLEARLTSLPLASTTRAGLMEVATPEEVTPGTDTTRAVTPAGLAAKVPNGPPLSLPRYTSSGDAVEGTPGLVTTADGRLWAGRTPDSASEQLQVGNALRIIHGTAAASLLMASYGPVVGSTITGNGARGSEATTLTASQNGDTFLRVRGRGHDGAAFPPNPRCWIDFQADETWTPTQQGTRLVFSTTLTGSITQAERLRLDGQGRVVTTGALGVGTPLTGTLGSGASYPQLSIKGSTLYVGQSSTAERPMVGVTSEWATSTDASRKARAVLSVYDATAAREGLRMESSGTAPMIGFLGATASLRITLPAAATDPATTMALANALRTALITFGLGA